jgi:hypothetical protein
MAYQRGVPRPKALTDAQERPDRAARQSSDHSDPSLSKLAWDDWLTSSAHADGGTEQDAC